MSVGQRIRDGRHRLRLSETEFAHALGVSRSAVQQWERVGGTAPKRSRQSQVATVLGISLAELLTGDSALTAGAAVRTKVPLVDDVEAGGYGAVDNFADDQDFEMVRVSCPVKRYTYALRVYGDSMTSDCVDSFPEGSIIIVEPEMEALPGDYVVTLNAKNETTFKQLIRDGGEFFLKPLNTRYPIRPLGTAKVIGVVREFTKKFR